MRIILAVALSTMIAAPAAAQYTTGVGGSYTTQRHTAHSTHKAQVKRSAATAAYAQQYRGSPYRGSRYSANPAYDVYVNGQYVGSDPDPRVRATLAQEWRSEFGMQ